MMIHLLGDERHTGHKGERFAKVFEGEFAHELVVCFLPHGV
jgi:hypothetical protein